MSIGSMQSIACCGLISTLYVSSLYVWRTPPSRQHPTTVKWRMLGVTLTSLVAWLPAWLMLRQLQKARAEAGLHSSRQLPMLAQLLGLSIHGAALLSAICRPLLLTAILFLGPLYHKARVHLQQWQQHRNLSAASCDAPRSASSSSTLGSPLLLHRLRDYVVAPVCEEWCFRACMVPLLWMQGFSRTACILMTPLFFGVCHIHHAKELLQAFGPTRLVLLQVLLQLAYTTMFGWFGTWVFVATGSIVSAMLVHSVCNIMGLPPVHDMDGLARLLCCVGVLGFVVAAPWMLQGDRGSGSVPYDVAVASQ